VDLVVVADSVVAPVGADVSTDGGWSTMNADLEECVCHV